ncbi:MAG: hypothetical protein K8M05_11990, partial [Deltaproteobacteria bacterium]|nr:hypothetical protein [Kofleriaceae bacterium]
KLGWIEPTRVFGTPSPVTVNVPNSTENPFALRIFLGAPVPATEYFLVENRRRTKRDSTLAADGLLVWHVRESAARGEPWEPRRPPLSPAEYAELAVSPRFVEYLRRFKQMVAG